MTPKAGNGATLSHAATPVALRVAGHFGELLQGRLGSDGPLALISLPCPVLAVELGGSGTPGLIGPRRLHRLCMALGLPLPSALPLLSARMPPGGGAGSSTAALVVVARALGWTGAPEDLARACVLAEGASDPLMFPHPEQLLFAPRQGRVLLRLPPLPGFTVIGGFLGEGLRTRAEDQDFPDIADLLVDWPGPLARLAALASESARRTLAHRGPAGDPTAALARDLGALGWLMAHTGSARGLIFAPGKVPVQARAALAEAGFTGVLQFDGGNA